MARSQAQIKRRFIPSKEPSKEDDTEASHLDEAAQSASTLQWQTQQLTTVPDTAYRIICPASKTSYTSSNGFQAADQSSHTPSDEEFRAAVINHLDWYAESPSPFVSVFFERRHAVNWAGKWSEHRGGVPCRTATIRLDQAKIIYSVKPIIQDLNIPTWLTPAQYEDELLILKEVSAKAIIGLEDVLNKERRESSDPV